MAIQAIQDIDFTYSLLGNLQHDIRELMDRFQNCSIQFNYRKNNSTAHQLAKFAYNIHYIVF